MSDDLSKTRVFRRRSFIIILCQFALAILVLFRLVFLQLIKYKDYQLRADSNRTRSTAILPLRGLIFDRNNVAIASNQRNYRLLYNLRNRSNSTQKVKKIAELLSLNKQDEEAILARIDLGKRRGYNLINLIDHLTWQEVARIESAGDELISDLTLEMGQSRSYPFGTIATHIIGYISAPSLREKDEHDRSPLYNHPNFKIGKNGIEKVLEPILAGEAGFNNSEVNVAGQVIRELDVSPSKSGQDIHTTIDMRMQTKLAEIMSEKNGAAVLLNTNGAIMSLYSAPSFDPSIFLRTIDSDSWKTLSQDPDKPLINKACSTPYPPGSTFKPVVALAALAAGADPKRTINCPGYYKIGNRLFRCWQEHGHGPLDMETAISRSCGVYFYTIGSEIGIARIAEMARRFGFGSPMSNIPLPWLNSGIMPDSVWKKSALRADWYQGDTLNAAIGQGYILATPLQLARYAARIATGRMIEPYMLSENILDYKIGIVATEPVAKLEHLELVRSGMDRVVNDSAGTAYGRRIVVEGMSMAGKTGTAQIMSRPKSGGKYLTGYENHGLFVGFAPVIDPQFAIAVVIEHGVSGSLAAAPVARDMLLYAQQIANNANS